MAGLSQLVVGVDGSPAAQSAVRWALTNVARGGCVHVLHATVGEPMETGAGSGSTIDLERDLARWCAELSAPGADVRCALVGERAGPALLQRADEVDADAIVVGHHREARFGPRVVGRVTAGLLHRAHRPVVVVPRDWTPRAGAPIVVGVGVTAATRAAVRWSVNRAVATKSGLHLVHALGPRTVLRPDGLTDVVARYIEPNVIRGWVEDDIADMASEISDEVDGQQPIDVSVERGAIGRRLVETGHEASVLVVGRGASPFRRWVMAPYLRHVLEWAPCPIVVVPADSDG